MKRLIIFVMVLLSVSAWAQQPANVDIVMDICRLMAKQNNADHEECIACAEEWVANLPQEKLPVYVEQAEKLLYPTYSTYCGRMTYRALLARLLHNGDKDDIALLRYRYQYEMLGRNNEGEFATDFVYYDVNGKEHRLSDGLGSNTLLIFNDPECEECALLREHIVATGELAGCTVDSTTTVLLVYPDEPTDAWREAVMHYPSTWIVGYSEDVSDLYDLRTLPSTYWLDEEQRVMKRDAHQ